jgi:molybdopterin-guanine dinucleotide biosynthesis protein A
MGGGYKTLQHIGGTTILARIIATVAPQLTHIVLNCNGPDTLFAPFGLPLVRDSVPGQAGPLAGILAGLEWAATAHPRATHLLSVPSDTPFLPNDLVARLGRELDENTIAVAMSEGRTHPTIALWPLSLTADLRRALVEEDIRKIDRFTARYPTVIVAFPPALVDPFLNINTPEEFSAAERLVARGDAG